MPWSDIARMRDHLTHHYFDTTHGILRHVVENELGHLEQAVARLNVIAKRLESAGPEA